MPTSDHLTPSTQFRELAALPGMRASVRLLREAALLAERVTVALTSSGLATGPCALAEARSKIGTAYEDIKRAAETGNLDFIADWTARAHWRKADSPFDAGVVERHALGLLVAAQELPGAQMLRVTVAGERKSFKLAEGAVTARPMAACVVAECLEQLEAGMHGLGSAVVLCYSPELTAPYATSAYCFLLGNGQWTPIPAALAQRLSTNPPLSLCADYVPAA